MDFKAINASKAQKVLVQKRKSTNRLSSPITQGLMIIDTSVGTL